MESYTDKMKKEETVIREEVGQPLELTGIESHSFLIEFVGFFCSQVVQLFKINLINLALCHFFFFVFLWIV